jgi:hypothetical protein
LPVSETFATHRDRVSDIASHVPMSLICHPHLECVGRLQQNREQAKSFRSLTEIFVASTDRFRRQTRQEELG